LRDSYDWDPATVLDGVGEAAIVGVEAALWTETLATLDELETMLFPRLCAVAEVAGRPPRCATGAASGRASRRTARAGTAPASPITARRRSTGADALHPALMNGVGGCRRCAS